MELIKRIQPNFVFSDARGLLTELVNGGYAQVNYVFTKKNAVRGNAHYHKTTRESFYIIRGAVDVTASDGTQTQTASFRTGDMFSIEPNIRHSFSYTADTDLIVLYSAAITQPDGSRDIHA